MRQAERHDAKRVLRLRPAASQEGKLAPFLQKGSKCSKILIER
jgi:hypothetical protein